MTVKVFVLDDHEIMRRGLRQLLDAEEDMVVVGEAPTADEALRLIPTTHPDVALVDVRLDAEGASGIEVCREARWREPKLRCIMLTSFADDQALFAAIIAGASGYVLKQVRGSDLVDAIRRVGRGESLIDPSLTGRLLERLRRKPENEEPLGLTDQERRILELIAEGCTNRQIADSIGLAEKTVKNYVSNLLTKLGMSRRTEAAAYAARLNERRRSGTR